MSDSLRGLPLLSGPPPPFDSTTAEIACRKCSKEFNVLIARPRKCNHCGYSYCHNCSDYQALMPRNDMSGYDPAHVCAYCSEFLTITAAGKNQLKDMRMQTLRNYINAYNINTDRVVEKDDLIDAIVSARGRNGCLPPTNETFYRNYSVPNKVPQGRHRSGIFSRLAGQSSNNSAPPPPPPTRPSTRPRQEFARPDLAPDHPQQHSQSSSQDPYIPSRPIPPPDSAYPEPRANNHRQPYAPPPGPPPNQGNPYQRPPPPPPRYTRPQPQQQAPPPTQQNYQTRPVPPRPASQRSAPTQNAPPSVPPTQATSAAPPPDLDRLLNMTQSAISTLSITQLKGILFTNHVNMGQSLEKSDLVEKVMKLVQDERKERRDAAEREQLERMQWQYDREEVDRQRAAAEEERRDISVDNVIPDQDGSDLGRSPDEFIPAQPIEPTPPPKPAAAAPPAFRGSASTLDRPGLCVVCQDEEANIAIVDCGHMAMCRACSELIMSSSRECPLCRTRIVTEARLLRIFKS